MAKVKYPLFSVSAAGSVGKLSYAKVPDNVMGSHNARYKPRPRMSPRSVGQTSCNERFTIASNAWNALTQTSKNDWIAYAIQYHKEARTEYIREYLLQRIVPPAQPEEPNPYIGGAF